MLVKFREKLVERSRFNGPAIEDVRTKTLSFSSYRWVLVAVAIASIYYIFLASSQYMSIGKVYVKSTNGAAAVVPQLQFLGAATPDSKDAQLAQAYINSANMLDFLEKKINFSEHYSSSEWDFYSRLPKDAPSEAKLKYFRKVVSPVLDIENGILKVTVRAYTPEFAYEAIQAVIKEADRFVNNVGQSIAVSEISFVENEIKTAQDRLQTARSNLLNFQNKHGILSADAAGASLQGVVITMESSLVELRTEEKVLASYLNASASELVTVRSKITALEEQIEIERAKLINQNDVSFNDVLADYKVLEMELKFATDIYATALISLEKARVESYRKLKHLVVIQAPHLPDSAILPKRLYSIITLFVVLTLAYGIVAMIIATIREHRDV